MRFVLMLLLLTATAAPRTALAEADDTRLALVIGNSRYEGEARLDNPGNDAREVAAALDQSGYDVTVDYDLTLAETQAALFAFGAKIRDTEADVAVIYYAGHGQEANGATYLIPVDAQLSEPSDLRFQAVRLDDALVMAERADRMSLVIVDACRDNPFRGQLRTAGRGSVGRGLGRPVVGVNHLVVYATQAGRTAADGEGDPHSPFTQAFLDVFAQEENLPVTAFWPRVTRRVYSATDQQQIPAVYGVLMDDVIRMRPNLTPAQIAQRDFVCQIDTGAQGVSFGQKCWSLDTTKIEYGDITSDVRGEITDASPLAGLTGLQRLYLSYTEVSDVTPLSGLTGLQKLYLSSTQVRDVTPLSGLTGLQRLDLSYTEVRDVTPLSGLTGLRMLNLHNTEVRDVTPLSGLTALRLLYLRGTQVRDVTPLSGLTGLQRLDLYSTQVRDVTPLSGLTGLRVLSLYSTQVRDVTPLSGLTGLRELSLSSTQVSDLTPLSGLTGLRVLYLTDTQVSDLTPLSGLTELQELYLHETQVSDVTPLSGLTGLQRLYLYKTQVSDVTPLSGLTGLRALYLHGTQVSDVTALSGLTGLYYLTMPDYTGVGGQHDTPENRAAVAEAIRTWRPRGR